MVPAMRVLLSTHFLSVLCTVWADADAAVNTEAQGSGSALCESARGIALLQRSQAVQKGPAPDLALEDEQLGTNTSGLCCENFRQWPSVDNGVTCGDCKALVLTEPYGGRCDQYCESFGHICVAAAEEEAEGCGVQYSGSCNRPITGTSDMLCTCRLPDGHASCSAPSPPPTPSPQPAPPVQPPVTGQCCRPFGEWPDVDGGVTCDDCTALVLARDYGGRCDRYCESFGHVCVAAAEERAESCEVSYSRPCDEAITDTSDILCTCRLPEMVASCPTPAPNPRPGGSSRIEVRGRQLLVDGVPVHLKGVAWNPVQKGSSRTDFRRYVEQDAALMARAGINAVRTYEHIGDSIVLDTLWAHGIWVLNSVYNYGGHTTRKVADQVNAVKDHPAILMWTIGNEWNYNGLYVEMSSTASMSRVAEVARLVRKSDKDHPIASIYGEVPSQHVIDSVPEVDVWGINIYRGLGFGDALNKFARRSGKPLFLGEYGADAYNARKGGEDQASQAKATKELTEEIVRRSSVRPGGICLGGFIFEFADEWWKDSRGSRSTHDVGGSAPGGGPYPDFEFNEEWWGLVDINRRPRAAFDAFAQIPVPRPQE